MSTKSLVNQIRCMVEKLVLFNDMYFNVITNDFVLKRNINSSAYRNTDLEKRIHIQCLTRSVNSRGRVNTG